MDLQIIRNKLPIEVCRIIIDFVPIGSITPSAFAIQQNIRNKYLYLLQDEITYHHYEDDRDYPAGFFVKYSNMIEKHRFICAKCLRIYSYEFMIYDNCCE
jgi:hypothetical protein